MSKEAFDRQRAALAIDGTAIEKHVLLVLATRGDAKGQCSPGIPRIAKDTGLSERSVHRALIALEAAGHIVRHIKQGVGTVYSVHPCQSVTPDTQSPLTHSQDTPDTVASKQPRTPITQKASPSSKRARRSLFELPADIPADEWRDFEEMRRLIHKPMTDSIRNKAIARLRKLADDGWPPGEVLSHSTLNNYQGLFPPKDHRNGNRTANDRQQPESPWIVGLRQSEAREAC